MKKQYHRQSDTFYGDFHKTPRFVVNDRGVFYKVRGGKLYGPFVSEQQAASNLGVFIQVTEIEQELETNRFIK